MKKIKVCAGICMILLFINCNKSNPDNENISTQLQKTENTITQINHYVSNINASLQKLEIKQSLIYSLGDYSFYVSKYLQNGIPVLYIEHGGNGEHSTIEKRYYLMNNKPVFFEEKRQQKFPTTLLTANKTYFWGSTVLANYSKQALSYPLLISQPYIPTRKISVSFNDETKKLNEAINQKGEFDLIFYGITAYPKAKYIILSKEEINSYRAPILVQTDDELTKELTVNPEKYRGRKLIINWYLKNNESAIYLSGSLN